MTNTFIPPGSLRPGPDEPLQPPSAPKTEVEILRDTIEALTKKLERAHAILKANDLDGIRGEASLPMEQKQ